MKKNKYWQLFFICFLGCGPFLLAWMMVVTGWMIPVSAKNHGELISPGHKVPPVVHRLHQGQWGLLFVGERCGDHCERRLVVMQQVHKALGKEFGRLQSIWLKGNDYELFPSKVIKNQSVVVNHSDMNTWFEKNEFVANDLDIWLIDPIGNIVLRFSSDVSGKDMLADIRWLLKVSRLG